MRRVLPVLLLLLVGGPALAGDEPTPAQAYESKVESLPEPSAEMGFHFRGVMRLNGKRAGHATLSAAPMPKKDGATRWLTKDALMIKVAAVPMVRVATAEFDRQLNPQAGVVRTAGMGLPLMEWKRSEAGITILAGSDVQSGVFPGASLHRELATLVAAGLTPAEAIRAATLDPARYLAGTDEIDSGLIAPGLRADLLLVSSPLNQPEQRTSGSSARLRPTGGVFTATFGSSTGLRFPFSIPGFELGS